MTFQKKNFADLYAQLENEARQRVPQLSDYQEGSVIRSLFESFAVELAVLYEQLDLVYGAGFIDTAEGDHLDRVVAVLGIKRNEPDFAAGMVTFRRDAGARDALTIPIGTLVTTAEDPTQEPSKKAYLTTAEAQLAAGVTAVDVHVHAEAPGHQMTTEAETIVVMPRPTPGIKAVTNQAPVRFLGRERESDEELRQRAKQALLASGRASATALENALLSLPGIRQVRLQEEQTKPGIVVLYVDGLTAENEAQVRQRIDEVRAAGIYVVLKPAQPIDLTVILRIRLDSRVKGEERELLEKRVATTVEAFIQRIPMGEPLLFAQLTAAVLSVKGVVDLEDFTITAAQSATAEAAQTTQYTALARSIPAGLNERFASTAVLIAADIRALPIDMLVQLSFPVPAVREQLRTVYTSKVADVKTNLAESTAIQALAENVRQRVIDELGNFYDQMQQAVAKSDWRVRLNEALQEPVMAALQGYFATLPADSGVEEGYVQAAAVGDFLQQTPVDATSIEQAQAAVHKAWAAQFDALQTAMLATFPSTRLETIIKTAAWTAYETTFNAAQTQLTADLTVQPAPDSSAQEAATTAFHETNTAAETTRDTILFESSALVTALYQETAHHLQQMAAAVSRPVLMAERMQSLYTLLGISLRTVDLTGMIQATTTQVKVTFVEQPTAGRLFIYTDRLELEGVIRLLLPPTATRAEKNRVKSALRQAIADYLAGLEPAQAIDLAQLGLLAAKECQVLFEPAALHLVQLHPDTDQRQLLADRREATKLRVQWSEKVFLAAEPQFTLVIEQ